MIFNIRSATIDSTGLIRLFNGAIKIHKFTQALLDIYTFSGALILFFPKLPCERILSRIVYNKKNPVDKYVCLKSLFLMFY